MQNLLSNAIKFRPKDRRPHIVVRAQRTERSWVFSVEDNGIGIDERYNHKIFGSFERLHSQDEFKGSGIGLAACKKIVEIHGGQIWFDSEVGKGSTFFFSIPHQLKTAPAETPT